MAIPGTSAHFAETHRVLARARILTNQQLRVSEDPGGKLRADEEGWESGCVDVLDVNGNGFAEVVRDREGDVKFAEPVLPEGLTELGRQAYEHVGGQVATQDDLGLGFATLTTQRDGGGWHFAMLDPISPSKIVDQLTPDVQGPKKWALDVAQGEFLVYAG